MILLPKSKLGRTLVIIFGGLALLVAVFYAEEDARGWLAWKNCQHQLAAKGETLDWDKYIPPPVPDDQNFFKAPKMTEWFVKGQNRAELQTLLQNTNTTKTITTEAVAREYLAWSDQFKPQFDLIREAAKRPYARMDGDYSKPFAQPIPNFISVRIVAQTLTQRAKCNLLLGQPDKALQELTLLHDMCRLLEAPPTGKPMTLVSAMINVAVTGLYADTIASGLQSHAWSEPQLAVLQKQLAEIHLTPFVFEALKDETAGMCRTAQIAWIPKMFDSTVRMNWTSRLLWSLWPSGWTYQNMVNVVFLGQKPLSGFDLANDTVAPRKFETASREVERFVGRTKSPFKMLAAIAVPNFTKAEQVTARTQTTVNEAQIACALERYRLAHGEHPGTLDALTPQFIENLPHDLIGGDSLIYRPDLGGKFLLYSIGWNEKDDGGKDGGTDFTRGDWVWKN